jgi:hypothetical protein
MQRGLYGNNYTNMLLNKIKNKTTLEKYNVQFGMFKTLGCREKRILCAEVKVGLGIVSWVCSIYICSYFMETEV